MTTLRDTTLVDASVPADATFADAARAISQVEIGAIAVVDADGRVVGLFTADDLVRGLFPGYLREMEHTIFLESDRQALEPRLDRSAARPVREFCQPPLTVELDADLAHVAERFLHSPHDSVAVVERRRFVGMLGQIEFCRALMRDTG